MVNEHGMRVRDTWRQWLNVAGAVLQVLASYFAPLTGLGITISQRAAGKETAVQPADYAFAIWGLIFPACLAYAVYQALPTQRENRLLRQIGWYTAAGFFGITAWSLLAQLVGGEWLLALVLVAILAVLLPAFSRVARAGERLSAAKRYFVALPISALTGWITVATFAATASALNVSGLFNASLAITWILLAGITASTLILLNRGDRWYTFAIIWGLLGVVSANLTRDPNPAAATTAGVMTVAVALSYLYTRLTSALRTLRENPA